MPAESKTARLGAAMLVLVAAVGAVAAPVAGVIRGLRTTLRAAGDGAPLVRVAAGSVREERQRLGFFRLGVLPLIVAEDVSLEVLDAPRFADALGGVPERLRESRREAPLEIHGLLLSFAGDDSRRLAADRAEVAGGRAWMLSGHVRWTTPASTGEVAQAILTVAGPQAGQLTPGGRNPAPPVRLLAHPGPPH